MQPDGEESPLVEGIDPSWNPVLSHIPEDKRSEIAPIIQQRHSELEELRTNYQPWEEFSKSGIDPETAQNAISIYSVLENQPHAVYEKLHNYLYPNQPLGQGQGKNVTGEEETEETGSQQQQQTQSDPKLAKMEQQLNTLAQIALAQKEERENSAKQQEEDAAVEKELTELKEKNGDFPEDEVVMRAYTKGISLEEALQDYNNLVAEVQKRRPAPFLLGGNSGQVPKPSVDVGKLDNKGTKDLVTQMLNHANAERLG